MRKLLFILSLVLTSLIVHAQDSIRVEAIVTDAQTGEPLPFASVQTADGSGTITNIDGEFHIYVEAGEWLLVSYVGYNKIKVTASQVKREIALQPFTHQLSNVVIDGERGILSKMVKHNMKKYNRNKDAKRNFFYRQLTRNNGKNSEIIETFFEGQSAYGLRNLKIINGRFSTFAATDNHHTIYNYWVGCQIMPLMKSISRTDCQVPLLAIHPYENYLDLYDISSEILTGKDGKSILAINFKSKETSSMCVLDGVFYFDKETYDLLQIKGVVKNVLFTTSLDGVNVLQRGDMNYVINYTLEHGFSEVENVSTNTTMRNLDGNVTTCQSLMFKMDRRYFKGKERVRGDEDLREVINEVGFNKKFWESNPIVKRTLEEEQALKNLSQMKLERPTSTLQMVGEVKQNSMTKLQGYADNIQIFNTYNPQEDIHFNTDQSYYHPGDMVWLAANVLNAGTNTPTEMSGVLYVELLNESGQSIIKRRYNMIRGAVNTGFSLPRNLPEGLYRLQAYTQYQQNWKKRDMAERRIIVSTQLVRNLSALQREEYRKKTAVHPDSETISFGKGQKDNEINATSPLLYLLTNSGNVVTKYITECPDTMENKIPFIDTNGENCMPPGYNRLSVINEHGEILRDTLLYQSPQWSDTPTYRIVSPQGELKTFDKVVIEVKGQPNTNYLLCVTDSAQSIIHTDNDTKDRLMKRTMFHADGTLRYDLHTMMGLQTFHKDYKPEAVGYSEILEGRVINAEKYPVSLRLVIMQDNYHTEEMTLKTDDNGNFRYSLLKYILRDRWKSLDITVSKMRNDIDNKFQIMLKHDYKLDYNNFEEPQGINCNAVIDSLLKRGKRIPSITDFVMQQNHNFHENDIPLYSIGDELKMYTKGGMMYNGRPVVWVVDGEVCKITGIPTKINTDATEWMSVNRIRNMPEHFSDLHSIRILTQKTNLQHFTLPPSLTAARPVVVELTTSMTWKLSTREMPSMSLFQTRLSRTPSSEYISRNFHYEFPSKIISFWVPSYEEATRSADSRRTLYWNPTVTTDSDGRAEITFYNNAECEKMLIKLE